MVKKMLFFLVIILIFSYLRENIVLVLNGTLSNMDSYKANIDVPVFLLFLFSRV